MSTSPKIKGRRASKQKSWEFETFLLYFQGKNNAEQLVLASLTCEIHLVKGMKANLLIGNYIMFPESFIINVKGKNALIKSWGVIVSIDARQKKLFLTKKPLASQEIVFLSHSKAKILLIPLFLPNNHDFLFYLATQPNLTLFTHIIDPQTLKVFVKNFFNKMLCISYRYKLGYLIDIAYDNCFFTNT